MEEGLKVILSADVTQFQEAFSRAAQSAKQNVTAINQTLSSTGKVAQEAAKTWKEFVGERMGQYMKQFGGHGPAIRQIAAEWAVYKEAVAQAGRAGQGVGETAGAVQKVAAALSSLRVVELPSTTGMVQGLNAAEDALKKFALGQDYVQDLDTAINKLIASTFAMGNTQGVTQLISSLQLLQAQKRELNAVGLDIRPKVDVADTIKDIQTIRDIVGREQFRFTLAADTVPLQNAMVRATTGTQQAVSEINAYLASVDFAAPSTAALVQGLDRAEQAVREFSGSTASIAALDSAIVQLNRTKDGLSNTTAVDALVGKLATLRKEAATLQAVGVNINPTVNVGDTLRDIERIKGIIGGQRFSFNLSADAKPLQNAMVLSVESTRVAVAEINKSLSLASVGFDGMSDNARASVAEYVKAIGQLNNVPAAVKTTVQSPDMTPVVQAVQKVKSEIASATSATLPRLTLQADTAPFSNAIKGAQATTQAAAQAIINDFGRIAAAVRTVGGNVNFGVVSFAPVVTAAKQAKANIDKVFLQPLPKIQSPQISPNTGIPQLKKQLHDTTGVGLQFNQLLREMPNFAIDARIGVMSLSNNLPYFVDAIQNARRQGQGFTGILKTIGSSVFSVSGIAILAVTAFTAFAGSMRKSKEEVADFGKEMREATRGAISEVATIQALVAVARDENNTRTQRLNAITELQKKYPDYLRNLNLENVNSLATAKAIDELTKSLVQKAVAQAYADKIADATLKRDELRDKLLSKTNEQLKRQIGFQQEVREMEGKGGIPQRAVDNEALAQQRLNREIAGMQKELQAADSEVDKYTKNLQDTTAATLALTRTPKAVKVKVDKTGEDALKKLAAYVKEMQLQATVDIDAVPRIQAPTDWVKQYQDNLKQQFAKEVDIPLSLNFTAEQIKANAISGGVDKVYTDYIEKFRNAKVAMPKIDPNDFIKEGGAAELESTLAALLAKMVDFKTSMKSIMSNAAVDTLSGFFEGVGEALSGGNFGKAFENILSVLGGAIIEMGKKLIATSAIIESFKKAVDKLLGPGGTQFGFAVGAAMVAIGSAMKTVKMPKFADGGIVFGPTMGLMGEYAGASSNPEVIAPLSKLKDLIGGVGGDKFPAYLPMHSIKGSELKLWYARAERQGNRYS